MPFWKPRQSSARGNRARWIRKFPENPAGLIADGYQGESYLSIVNDGALVDLIDPPHKPKNFINRRIHEISNNLSASALLVLVRYTDGSIAGFNTLTGESLNWSAYRIRTSWIMSAIS